MVLAVPVGRARPAWVGFLLTIATFGFYTVYWDIRAHRELMDQFELVRERRSDQMHWYAMAAPVPFFSLVVPVFPILRLVYYHGFAGNVAYLLERFGRRVGAARRFMPMVAVALGILYVGLLVGTVLTAAGLQTDGSGDLVVADNGLITAGLLVLLGAVVVNLTLRIIAYVGLQNAINDLWAQYAARVQALRPASHPPAAPTVPAPSVGPSGAPVYPPR